MQQQPPCAPGNDPPHDPEDHNGPEDGDDSYPIAIGLRRHTYSGQFRPKQPGDPQPGLFDYLN